MEVFRVIIPWEKQNEAVTDLDARRVAVLPLKKMSPDPSDEYFAMTWREGWA